MATGFDLSGLSGYTDEISFGLISEAVLGSTIMQNAQVRPGLTAGTTAINILKSDLVPAASACSWSAVGESIFEQVDLTIVDLQVKETYCPETLRGYWLSSQLSPAGQLEEIPFADSIAQLKVKQIKQYVETAVFSGEGAMNGLIVDVTSGNGAVLQPNWGPSNSAPAAFTAANAIYQVNAIVSVIPSAVLDRPDLIIYMSYANFRTYCQALVTANYFMSYNPAQNNTGIAVQSQMVVVPGTNVVVKPFVGLGTSNRIICGSASELIIGVGLMDDFDKLDVFYDKYNDQVKVMAKFRIGAAVAFIENWVTNDLS